MKQRTTYLVSDPSATHPDNFVLQPRSLHIKSIKAAREDRFTIKYGELSPEIKSFLKQCDQLHVRWSTSLPYQSVDPFGSRVPAGLHVFLTPQPGPIPPICEVLSLAFGINDCNSFELSFIEIPGARQFYSQLPSIKGFRAYVEDLMCSIEDKVCKDKVASLDSADYLDLKYDGVSQKLVINTYWSQPQESWSETITPIQQHKDIEVGVLGNDKTPIKENVALGGFLHSIGEDENLDPVMFTFASRHFSFPSFYSLTTIQPTGMHPLLKFSITSPLNPPQKGCALNTYFTLPRGLFVDKYQLSSSNPELLKSLNIKRIRDVAGETDLEAPIWASELWGSSVVVEIDYNGRIENDRLEVGLPLHLRYLEPQDNTTKSAIQFANPSLFWACPSQEWRAMADSPFDRVRLGWEHIFPEQTMYYHLSPSESAWKLVDVPVLSLQYAGTIKGGTLGFILGGLFWVLWKMFIKRTDDNAGDNAANKGVDKGAISDKKTQ